MIHLHYFVVLWLVLLAGCGQTAEQPSKIDTAEKKTVKETEMTGKHHEVVDIERWIKEFPLSMFEKTSGPRKFVALTPNDHDDPVDLWKASGEILISPSSLAIIEQVRRRVSQTHDLGKAVPTDIFLFGVGKPKLPYLTKIGGVPYRPADRIWPAAKDGTPMLFFAQFCFLDSMDILPSKLPGDVMLLFIKDWDTFYQSTNEREYCIEWSSVSLPNPITANNCPKTDSAPPEYYGTIYRTNEYPESEDIFYKEGHYQPWLFATTQATRIGTETCFIQGDHYRQNGNVLLCSLNCIFVSGRTSPSPYPFVNVKSSAEFSKEQTQDLEIILGDCGCIYFLLDSNGNIRWEHDCY